MIVYGYVSFSGLIKGPYFLLNNLDRGSFVVIRLEKVRNVLLVVLFLNVSVSFSKIAYGMLTQTLSMQADGYHSLFDGVSNIIGLIGVMIASRPPDTTHPYGYHKYETMASLGIALLLVVAGFEILSGCVERYIAGTHPEVTSLSFAVMFVTMGINLFVTSYEKNQGMLLKSEILLADSVHTKTDIYISLSVIAGLAAIRIGYPVFELLVSLIISIMIVGAGFSIFRESVCTLCDVSRIDEESIRSAVSPIDGVFDCHRVRTHGARGHIHVDLHVSVSSDMHTSQSHEIADAVEELLKSRFEDVADVMVHIEPAEAFSR